MRAADHCREEQSLEEALAHETRLGENQQGCRTRSDELVVVAQAGQKEGVVNC